MIIGGCFFDMTPGSPNDLQGMYSKQNGELTFTYKI